MKISFKKLLLIICIVLILILILVWAIFRSPEENTKTTKNQQKDSRQTTKDSRPEDEIETPIPESYDIKVPFISQAPFGIWDELHDEACEEASILLVHYFYQGINLTRERMDQDIRALVNYQIKKYGKHKDLTSQETADLAKEYFNYKDVGVVYDFSWEDLKKEIIQDHPVIIPAAGRLLGNPYFTAPGPVYHMLVIRGYNQTEVITNDVGTRRGESYTYTYDVLDQAIHDWTGSYDSILSGRRAFIVIND
ncbi:C39 family peptidase [Patescibacteria group bacterium]